MALLRRGSSRISEANFESRLQREKAKEGAITASLAWNDPSDLDLHAYVYKASGGVEVVSYRNKRAAGGFLDVDMHARDGEEVPEPVENIFWKNPPAGTYSIHVHLYKKRGARDSAIPFRALLKREDEEDLSREGEVAADGENRNVEVFRFTVDEDGEVKMGRVGTGVYPGGAAPTFSGSLPGRAMRLAMRRRRGSMKVMKKVMKKAMKKKKPMKKPMKKAMKLSTVAKGKKAKVQVYKGTKGKVKTKGGLKKEDLVKSKKGKIVSAKRSKQGKQSKWALAREKARAIKGYTGFKAIKKGTSFYVKAKEVLAEM